MLPRNWILRGFGAIALLCTLLPAYAERTDLELVGEQGVHYFFTLSKPWSQDQKYLKQVSQNFCSTKVICITHIWDPKDGRAPKSLPFTDKQVDNEVVTYQGNKNTGRSKFIWNCKKFPNESTANCFMPGKGRQ